MLIQSYPVGSSNIQRAYVLPTHPWILGTSKCTDQYSLTNQSVLGAGSRAQSQPVQTAAFCSPAPGMGQTASGHLETNDAVALV